MIMMKISSSTEIPRIFGCGAGRLGFRNGGDCNGGDWDTAIVPNSMEAQMMERGADP